MTFQKVNESNLSEYRMYFSNHDYRLSAYSYVSQIFWSKLWDIEFCLQDNYLFLSCQLEGKRYFLFPLILEPTQQDYLKALQLLERHCLENSIPLRFSNIPQEKLDFITKYFRGRLHLSTSRKWADYFYNVQDFRNYQGRKYNTCRNNVNRFKKLYPGAKFVSFDPNYIHDYLALIESWEKDKHLESDAILNSQEYGERNIILNFQRDQLIGGHVILDDKIIGLSIGEYCGDTVIVHLEKAMKEYKGIYQFLAHEFAKYVDDKIVYVNREDDAGVLGLRKSKQQYHPCFVYDGWVAEIERLFDSASMFPTMKSDDQQLVLADLTSDFYQSYFELASDYSRSLSWGWDYKKELVQGQEANIDFFVHDRQECIDSHKEYSWIIYYRNQLAGELSLHNFDYHGHVEIGMRILPKFEHQGICKRACQLLIKQCFDKWGLSSVWAKCYLDNNSSFNLLKSLDMEYLGHDETWHYFYLGDYFDPKENFWQ